MRDEEVGLKPASSADWEFMARNAVFNLWVKMKFNKFRALMLGLLPPPCVDGALCRLRQQGTAASHFYGLNGSTRLY